jgi:hypothetical protein
VRVDESAKCFSCGGGPPSPCPQCSSLYITKGKGIKSAPRCWREAAAGDWTGGRGVALRIQQGANKQILQLVVRRRRPFCKKKVYGEARARGRRVTA